jgi:hypothetical protein
MKQVVKGVKGTMGLGFGFACSAVFVMTMDELVYANFKKNVMMPFHLARLNGSNVAIA